MVTVLPKIPTFAEQFSQSLGQGLSQGLGNIPDLAMNLAAQRRQNLAQLSQQGLEQYKNLVPDSTAQEQANFYSQLTKEGKKLKSPEDIVKKSAELATQSANERARVKAAAEGPGIFSDIKEYIKTGSVRGLDAKERSARAAIKPYLERGDLVTARSLISNKGFNAEQRERIIGTELNKDAKQLVDQFPKLSKFKGSKFEGVLKGKGISGEGKGVGGILGQGIDRLSEEQRNLLTQNMKSVFDSDPNVNPILLREQYEKRGVDWRDFRDSIEELADSGQIKFTDEQMSLLQDIEQPPLSRLEKALRTLRLVKK